SALDQAFIKAYAKDGPPLGSQAAHASDAAQTAGSKTRRALTADADAIERIYCDAVLYRVDSPRATAPRRSAVPTPHIQLAPRTSPRRNVRRSLLMLRGQSSGLATPMPVEPPPRQSTATGQPSIAVKHSRIDDRGTARLRRPARYSAPASPPHESGANRRSVRTLADIANKVAPPPAPLPLPREQRVELRPEIVFDPPQADEPLPVAAPEAKVARA